MRFRTYKNTDLTVSEVGFGYAGNGERLCGDRRRRAASLSVLGTAETNLSQMFSDPRWVAAAIHDRTYKCCLFRDGIIQRKREPRSQRAMIVLVNDSMDSRCLRGVERFVLNALAAYATLAG